MATYWLLSGRVGSEHKPLMGPGGNALYLAFLCTPSMAQKPQMCGLSDPSLCSGFIFQSCHLCDVPVTPRQLGFCLLPVCSSSILIDLWGDHECPDLSTHAVQPRPMDLAELNPGTCTQLFCRKLSQCGSFPFHVPSDLRLSLSPTQAGPSAGLTLLSCSLWPGELTQQRSLGSGFPKK